MWEELEGLTVKSQISEVVYTDTTMEEATAIDFSSLTDAIAAKSYDKIADVCDNLMLQAGSLFSSRLITLNP